MSGFSFFSLRRQPGSIWPTLLPSDVSTAWAAYLQLDYTQWLEPAEIERLQLTQLRHLLTHCIDQVPYYRDSFCSAGIEPEDIESLADLHKLPLLPRHVYQQRFFDLVASTLPVGTMPAGAASTSGTSGLPIEVRQTNVVGLWWLAFYLRDLEWCQINPRGKLASIRTARFGDPSQQRAFKDGITLPYWHPHLQRLIETGPSFGMDLHQDPRRQLSWLCQMAPDYLLSYPSNLDYLAQLVKEEDLPVPSLKVIQCFSETLSDSVQTRIESAFGVPVRNLYSSAEAGYLASPCPDGHGLHVHAENVILEVLDDKGRPCAPGEPGRVVITTLHNFLAPFIRYEILDHATPGPHRCPCGRGLPLLLKVEGKRRPLFWLPDGRRIMSVWLVEALRKLGGIRQQQIIQRATDLVVVRIVPGAQWSANHVLRIQQCVDDGFGVPIRTEVQVMERLELPAGGKLIEVINELEKAPGGK